MKMKRSLYPRPYWYSTINTNNTTAAAVCNSIINRCVRVVYVNVSTNPLDCVESDTTFLPWHEQMATNHDDARHGQHPSRQHKVTLNNLLRQDKLSRLVRVATAIATYHTPAIRIYQSEPVSTKRESQGAGRTSS